MNKPYITLMDLVTSTETTNGVDLDSFYKVIGIKHIQNTQLNDECGGIFELLDIVTKVKYTARGNTLTKYEAVPRHKDFKFKLLKTNGYFCILTEPYKGRKDYVIQNSSNMYIDVINMSTGEKCVKKLYKNTKGLHFKHKGFKPSYLSDFDKFTNYIPLQFIDVEEK